MFHQVRVSPNDYDVFRFLWWLDNALDQEPVDYHMGVHLFGATSSPACSNFALNDCFKSVESSAQAVNLAAQL